MIKPGDVYTTEVVFKQDDVDAFSRLTGDYNLVHTDDQYARNWGSSNGSCMVCSLYHHSPGSLGWNFQAKEVLFCIATYTL